MYAVRVSVYSARILKHPEGSHSSNKRCYGDTTVMELKIKLNTRSEAPPDKKNKQTIY